MKETEYFACRYVLNNPATEISIPIKIRPVNQEFPWSHCVGIFDTGATQSMISAKVARELHLKPIGRANVSGVHGVESSALYDVDFYFPNGYKISHLTVSEASEDCGFDLLIGMDIISQGNLIIANQGEHIIFMFSYPADR